MAINMYPIIAMAIEYMQLQNTYNDICDILVVCISSTDDDKQKAQPPVVARKCLFVLTVVMFVLLLAYTANKSYASQAQLMLLL